MNLGSLPSFHPASCQFAIAAFIHQCSASALPSSIQIPFQPRLLATFTIAKSKFDRRPAPQTSTNVSHISSLLPFGVPPIIKCSICSLMLAHLYRPQSSFLSSLSCLRHIQTRKSLSNGPSTVSIFNVLSGPPLCKSYYRYYFCLFPETIADRPNTNISSYLLPPVSYPSLRSQLPFSRCPVHR